MDKGKIAVLGAGTMGPGIALNYAIGGYETALYSRSQKTLDRAAAVIRTNQELLDEILPPEVLFYPNLSKQAKNCKESKKRKKQSKEMHICLCQNNTVRHGFFEPMPRGLLLGLVQRMDYTGMDMLLKPVGVAQYTLDHPLHKRRIRDGFDPRTPG